MRRDADGAIITQFDYPTCESLGLLKMDFLGLRNLTIMDDAVKTIKANQGIEARPARPAAGRPGRPTSCWPAATRSASSSSTAAPMRSLLRLMKPDNFEDISAVLALYRPGPMGANSHTNYALRKNGQQEITPIHPELEEPLEEILDADLRPDRLPGAGAERRADARRLLARPGRPAAPGDGQEEEGDPGQGVRPVPGRHAASTATPTRRSRRCGTSWSRSPATPSTRRTPPRTAWSRTGPPTSRRNYPAEYMAGAAHLASATTRTRRRST